MVEQGEELICKCMIQGLIVGNPGLRKVVEIKLHEVIKNELVTTLIGVFLV